MSVSDDGETTDGSFKLDPSDTEVEKGGEVAELSSKKKRKLVTLTTETEVDLARPTQNARRASSVVSTKKRSRTKSKKVLSPSTPAEVSPAKVPPDKTILTIPPKSITAPTKSEVGPSKTPWMPASSRSGRTIKRRVIATDAGTSPGSELAKDPRAESPFADKSGARPCERKGCPLDVPICFANEAPSCASSRFTARWYHLSSGEHFCNDCYEVYYRGGHRIGRKTRYMQWKRHWQANSRYVEGTMRNFAADQILPFWVECTRAECGKWRQLGRAVELTRDYVTRFTCGVIFDTGTTVTRSTKACDIPEDSRAYHIRADFGDLGGSKWLSTLSAVPLLKSSPAALFLYEYYPDGVGLSPSCELCKSTDEENREKHSNLVSGREPAAPLSPKENSANGAMPEETTVTPSDTERPKGFASAKLRRSASKAKKSGDSKRSPHPYLQTSPTKHLGGAVATTITPVGVNHNLQPFYQPFESQKARAIRPDVMEPWELEAFSQYERAQYLYLGLRNTIVALWTLSPRKWLTMPEIAKHVIVRGLVRVYCLQAARKILIFLTIKGFVNVGILPKPDDGFLPSKFRRYKVVVIGAGPSGLSAARQLHNFGSEVVVIEGRDRIGGRVWDDTSTTGVPVGQGAHIVVGVVNNPVTLMCHQSGLHLREMNSSKCDLIDARNGELLEYNVDDGVNNLFNSALDDSAKWRKGKTVAEDESLLKRMQEWGKALNKETEQEQRAFLFHVSNLEYACGSNLRHVSARSWDHNDQYDQFAGEHCLLVDGFQALLIKLADGLDIRFGARVVSVDYSGEGVRVTTADGPFDADKVVVTLPLRQLQDGAVEFCPPLPEEKLDAINKLGAGRLEKVALRFERNFWADKVGSADFFGHIPSAESDRGWFGVFYDLSPKVNESKEDGPFVLMSWVSGDAVDAMAAMSETEIIAKCLGVLRGMFCDVPDPIAHLVTRWSADPMAGMAYSFVKVHGEGSHYDTLAKSINDKLFFAGEATQRRYPQTVTGALLSGVREASKIVVSDWEDFADSS